MKSKMESKMKIKPIVGTERLFKILNKRIQTGVSNKNKSGKTFSLEKDAAATRLLYQNIIDSLPSRPGIIIITGYYKNSFNTLEIIKSDENIKQVFLKSRNNKRYQSLNDYMNNELFDHIQIQLASAS